MNIIKVSDTFAVAPQILEVDMPAIKAQGITTIINNRPDGEADHPSTNASLQAAAQALGLNYYFVPVIGMNFPAATVAQMAEILQQSSGKVLAFCRTGNRSINTWARANQSANTGVDVAALVASTGFKLA
ncbi:MAG: TIGR01244 family sulfur transferase [Gammaproteobacteria bacterium]|nr:TIGR01244 family sulfur transferase [Gammaproteobacteria bacterium]